MCICHFHIKNNGGDLQTCRVATLNHMSTHTLKLCSFLTYYFTESQYICYWHFVNSWNMVLRGPYQQHEETHKQNVVRVSRQPPSAERRQRNRFVCSKSCDFPGYSVMPGISRRLPCPLQNHTNTHSQTTPRTHIRSRTCAFLVANLTHQPLTNTNRVA